MSRTGGEARIGRSARRALQAVFTRDSAPLWVLVGAASVVATLFVALGGLGPADRTPAPAEVGEEVRTSLYAVTVLDAELTDEVEDRAEAEPGEDLIVLTLTMENLTDAPIGVVRSVDGVASGFVHPVRPLLHLVGAAPTDSARAWRDDSSAQVVLQPGVPAEVRIAWPVPEGSFSAGTVQLDVFDAVARSGRFFVSSTDVTWRRAEPVARIAMEVSP